MKHGRAVRPQIFATYLACMQRRMKIAWPLYHLCRQSVTKERESSATFPE